MTRFDKFSEDFEKLLLKSDFGDLSKEELALLEAEGITEEEFHSIKKTLEALESIQEEPIAPSSNIKSKLMDAFDEKPKRKGLIISFPFWITSGISIAALLAIAFFLLKPGADYNPTSTPVAQKIPEKQQKEIGQTEESFENAFDNASKEEISLPDAQENNVLHDIPAPAAEEILEKADLVVAAEDVPEKALQIREEVDFEISEPIAAKEISNSRMAQAEDVSAIRIDSHSINAITTSANSISFSPNSALSSVSVIESSKINKGVVVTKKKSYSLAENPSDLKNLVTIY
jgi:hypothetical protein